MLLQMTDSKRKSLTNCNDQLNRVVVDLPEEMVSDILSRLPIELILICRIVCKRWYAMTREPSFINKLSNSRYQPTRLILKSLGNIDTPNHLLVLNIEEHKTRHIPIEKMLVDLQIMCSCNGLHCLASDKNLDPVVIYNPITRERVILPPSNSKSVIYHQQVGLGFDPSTDKYKVVRSYTGFISMHKVGRFEIISLGESSWRELSPPLSIVNRDIWAIVSCNGALYWTMNKGISIIVQFNLRDEKFRVVPFPDSFSASHVSGGLFEVWGYLTLVQNDCSMIKFWRIIDNVDGELSLSPQDTYDTHVKWGGLHCAFVCQMKQESYLLHVGFWNSRHQRQEHLTRYFPEKIQNLNLEIPGLPGNFKPVCFKPSLVR